MTHQPILATVSRDDFVGREAELRQIVRQAAGGGERGGLLLLAAPNVGATELLRQAYDELFTHRRDSIPIHFVFRPDDDPRDVARGFFQNLLQQYMAYRRVDPTLCGAPFTFHDLVEFAPPGDHELVTHLLERFERERLDGDERTFLRFCLTLPQRLFAAGHRIVPLIDCSQLGMSGGGEAALGRELAAALSRFPGPYAVTGLRRQLLDLVYGAGEPPGLMEIVHLERLGDDAAQKLIERAAHRHQVKSNESTRDLIVQQLNASPFFIKSLVQAAHATKTPLTSFLNCQRLYVDELMGGRIQRHFSSILDKAVPQTQTRKQLLRVLHESMTGEAGKSSLWAWKKRLGVDASECERIIAALHIHELVNSSGALIEVNADSDVWIDYLRVEYRLAVAGEPRASVVANILVDTLKRAPQAMARKYRRESTLGVRDLLSRFNCQRVPASVFQYDRFAAEHKGVDIEPVSSTLEAESDLLMLPQIVQVAGCAAFAPSGPWEEERWAIGHGFEAADYTDEKEIVWLAAEIDSKLEASRELTAESCNRLSNLARECGFEPVRLWLVAAEGFSPEACELLKARDAYSSSRRQVELLSAYVKSVAEPRSVESSHADEFEMVIPMGADTELIAAHTVEQIARRVNFVREAINQIKTALVEACITATEQSLSPDRKIYQRFRVEEDKLVVTVSSRGIMPAGLGSQGAPDFIAQNGGEGAKSRRGWGLKLIKTLMDEVEFEHIDDGTQLRMVKYLRSQ